jgi:antitoxin (DNA-binding transcriptional repressor) of toxin-antitoxin stability system
VEITKHGRTVARLVPAHGSHALRGRFVGVAITTDASADLFDTGAGFKSEPLELAFPPQIPNDEAYWRERVLPGLAAG